MGASDEDGVSIHRRRKDEGRPGGPGTELWARGLVVQNCSSAAVKRSGTGKGTGLGDCGVGGQEMLSPVPGMRSRGLAQSGVRPAQAPSAR